MRIQLPAAHKMQWIFLHLRKWQEYERCMFTLRKTAVLLSLFSLASADGKMTGEKTPWSSLVSGAVLASYKSCSVLGVSAQIFLLQVQHWHSLMPRYCVSDLRK